jgi:hypothetical protein
MATVTPNFNWPVPTSTDLVKDGATAIEALGDSIDASLVDLKGGTTGQVLSKTSGTDMDFTWVTTDDANAIQNSIVDAKGDLISATGNDTPARLAVGNNGETLVADSSATTGLRYTAGTVQANPVLNSAFQNWQRGTSISVAASGTPYTADRWQVFTNASQACTVSRQLVGDSTNLPSIQYGARVQRNSGQTGTGGIYYSQCFESINSVPFAGKTVTLSFYARAGANYSAASSVLSATMATGTGTDQNLIASGYTGAAYPINSNATLTTTWQRFTYTGTVSSTANEICLYFGFTPVGTAGAADYFDVTGVQIDIGSVALPFRTYAGTIQGELSACQRYYEKSYNQATAPANAASTSNVQPIGVAYTTGVVRVGNVLFKVTKRTAPIVTLYNTNVTASAGNWAYYAGGWGAPTSTSAATILQTGFLVDISKTSTFTAQNAYMTDGDWAADAEL